MNELLNKAIEAKENIDDLEHLTFDINREIRSSFIDLGGAFETFINAINKYIAETKG